LRIAVVGLGHMGKIHLSKLVALEGVEVSLIVDTDPLCTAELSEKTGVRSCRDYGDAIQSCDAALIATSTETHHHIGKAFLEAGKHVFLEKPVTVAPKEAQELIDIAHKKGLVLQVGHLERFNPAFLHALPRIEKPVLIEATRISPFTGRSTDVDVVLDLMIHDLDLVLSLVHDEIRSVSAQGVCFMTDNLDAVNATIEFSGGCVANVAASRISPKKERSITIYETDKSFTIDLLSGKCISIVKTGQGTTDTKEYAATRSDAVLDELQEFIDSIKGYRTPSVTGHDGLKALMLAARIKDYIADKQRISTIQ